MRESEPQARRGKRDRTKSSKMLQRPAGENMWDKIRCLEASGCVYIYIYAPVFLGHPPPMVMLSQEGSTVRRASPCGNGGGSIEALRQCKPLRPAGGWVGDGPIPLQGGLGTTTVDGNIHMHICMCTVYIYILIFEYIYV